MNRRPEPARETSAVAADPNEASQKSRAAGDFVARLIIALGIYVASIGPMYWTWLQAKYLNGSWFIAALYEPLWIAAGLIPPLGHWLNWYVSLWIF